MSIEALKIVQKSRGWVSDIAVKEIAEILNIHSTDVEEVATFYSQIFRKPVGRHIILYCDSVVCYINGYELIRDALEKILGIKPGQTTCDNCFTLLPTCCLGCCDKGPVIMVDEDNYFNLKPKDIYLLLKNYK